MKQSAIQKYVSGVREKFAAIDKDMSELQARADELTAAIESEGNSYSLEATQKTATLRQELALVNESLSKAQAERDRMSGDLAANMRNDLHATKQEFVADKKSENAAMVQEIWNLSKKLRRMIWDLDKIDDAARVEYNAAVTELNPCLDEKGQRDLWTYRSLGGLTMITPYLHPAGHDYRLIRHISEEAQHYNLEFKEDAANE